MNLNVFIVCILLIYSSHVHSLDTSKKVYRIIRTSPAEFVSALKISPTNQNEKKQATSRLAQFFRVKNKRVVGKNIDIEVIPSLPLLSEYFPNINLLQLKMFELNANGNSFIYDLFFLVKNSEVVQAELSITPHPLGSLLSLNLKNTNYPEWAVSAFLAAASGIGFIAKTEADAIKQ